MDMLKELVPTLYLQGENDLAGFLEAFQSELSFSTQKIDEIKKLFDVDSVPSKYLPYLAALTNASLIGSSPIAWRKNIRNWAEVLRWKGTKKGVETFLSSVGFSGLEIQTYFRNERGELVTYQPDGLPFFDSIAQEWRNIRTHYFSLESNIEFKNSFGSVITPEILTEIKEWLDVVKPFDSELLDINISILPPNWHSSCYYNKCKYSHGWYPMPVDLSHFWNGNIDGNFSRSVESVRSSRAKYVGQLIYNYGKYNSLYKNTAIRISIQDLRSQVVKCNKSNSEGRIWSFAFAQAAYNDGEPFGSLNCAYSPRYMKRGNIGKFGVALFNNFIETPHFEPIYRYHSIRHSDKILDDMSIDSITLRGLSEYRRIDDRAQAKSIILYGKSRPSNAQALFRGWVGEWKGPWISKAFDKWYVKRFYKTVEEE